MEAKTKTFSLEELNSTYRGDSLNVHDELIAEFKQSNPGATIKSSAGDLIDNGDETFTYNLTIEYEG